MSAVAGSPELLDALALGLGRQARGHGGAGAVLGHAVAAAPRASIVGPAALDLLVDTARGLDDLERRFDDLAGYVRRVSGALQAADTTLADALGPGTRAVVGSGSAAGTNPAATGTAATGSVTWTGLTSSSDERQRLGDMSRSVEWRAVERGGRRTGTVTITDPFGPNRTTTTTHTEGVTPAGRTERERVVTLWSTTGATSFGVGNHASWGGAHASVDIDTFGGARASGTASAGYGNGQVHLAAGGSAAVEARATASTRAGNDYASVEGSVSASVGAGAEGEARLGVGKDGVHAEVNARLHAGGEFEAKTAAEVLGVRGEATGGLTYGIGGEFGADAEVGMDKIEISLDLGLTFGLGLSGSVDVSVSPRETIAKSIKGAKKIGGAVKGLFS